MRSSRHQVASAACRTSGGAARSRMAATSPTSCVSTQRTTSAMVRPSRVAATKRGARSFPAVAYQNSPSAVVPSLLAASHRSAAARHASRHSPQPVRGDQVLARAPVEAVGSMHHTWPSRALVPSVWRRRSLLTLAASTGPRQPRIAGTAKLVVLPLCVGPDHDEGLGRFGGEAGEPRHARQDTEEQTARRSDPRGPPAASAGRATVAHRAPRPSRRAPLAVLAPPAPCQEMPAKSAPPRAMGRTRSGRLATS